MLENGLEVYGLVNSGTICKDEAFMEFVQHSGEKYYIINS